MYERVKAFHSTSNFFSKRLRKKTISITILFFESLKNFLSKIFLVRGGCRFQSLKTSKLKGKLHMREKDRWAISCTYLGIMKKKYLIDCLCLM